MVSGPSFPSFRARPRTGSEAPDQLVQLCGVRALAQRDEELALPAKTVGGARALLRLEELAAAADEVLGARTLQALDALEEVAEVHRLGHAEYRDVPLNVLVRQIGEDRLAVQRGLQQDRRQRRDHRVDGRERHVRV